MNYKLILLGVFFLLITFKTMAGNVEEGKDIFKTRCVSCHALDKVLVGPALKNVHEKYDVDWFVKFVTSSTSMVLAKDERALKVFNEFNKIPMPDHKDLDGEKIKGIYAYIKLQSEELAKEPAVSPIPRLEDKKSGLKPIQGGDVWVIWLWVGIVVVIVIGLVVAVSVNDLKDILKNDKRE